MLLRRNGDLDENPHRLDKASPTAPVWLGEYPMTKQQRARVIESIIVGWERRMYRTMPTWMERRLRGASSDDLDFIMRMVGMEPPKITCRMIEELKKVR